MTLTILYFAGVRDALGCERETYVLAAPCTAAALREQLAARPGCEALGSYRNLKCAINQVMVPWQHEVQAGDEVAFFPPVTGG